MRALKKHQHGNGGGSFSFLGGTATIGVVDLYLQGGKKYNAFA
jgi:hypothetical protein